VQRDRLDQGNDQQQEREGVLAQYRQQPTIHGRVL
jgi:hypothetical protein